MAVERGLDLVEVSPDADPPVCRILDFGKFKYELKQKSKRAKKKQRPARIKEIRLKLATDVHDVELKVKHAREFLQGGDKVLMVMSFRGREIVHKDLGLARMAKIAEQLAPYSRIERPLASEGTKLVMMFAPK